jgi:hypothetical protein
MVDMSVGLPMHTCLGRLTPFFAFRTKHSKKRYHHECMNKMPVTLRRNLKSKAFSIRVRRFTASTIGVLSRCLHIIVSMFEKLWGSLFLSILQVNSALDSISMDDQDEPYYQDPTDPTRFSQSKVCNPHLHRSMHVHSSFPAVPVDG